MTDTPEGTRTMADADLTVRKDDPTVPDAVEPDAPTQAERPNPSAETELPQPPTEAVRPEPAANTEQLQPAAEAVRPESSAEDGLLPAGDVDQYRTDWRAVQSGFVDDPEGAVHKADALVGRLADTIVDRIAEQRAALADARVDETPDEASGDDGQTERLRLALQEYRTLFQQLLPAGRS